MARWPLALLVAAAVALLSACGDAVPAGRQGQGDSEQSPSAGELPEALMLYREAAGDIIAFDLRTGESFRHRIDFNTEIVITAECAADGSRIAYLRQLFAEVDRQVVIAGDSAPEEPLRISPRVTGIAWSPDGKRLAVAEFHVDTGYTMSLLDPETGRMERIIGGIGFTGAPRWSPDDTRLAYHGQFGVNTQVFVYEIGSAAERPTMITEGAQDSFDPDWSPNGRTLLFSRQDENGVFQLYEIDLTSEDAEPVQLTTSDIFKRLPRYSPDGGFIGYTGSIVTPLVSRYASKLHQFGIFLLRSDGSDERPVTADPRQNPGAGVDPFLDSFLLGWCPRGPWLDDTWERESGQ